MQSSALPVSDKKGGADFFAAKTKSHNKNIRLYKNSSRRDRT